MSSENLGDTIPTRPEPPATSATQPMAAADKTKPELRKRTVIILGVVLVLVFIAAGSWLGYQSGLDSRIKTEQSQVALEAATQFQYGLQDQAAGKLESAQQRFEFVVSLDPNFPGITEKLTEVMVAIDATNAPTPVPTPTLSPTPDLRGEQDLYAQVLQFMADKNWQKAIDTMDALRAKNLNYQTINVDGQYFIALRFLGINKIGAGDLEGGIYALTLAERFAPLDNLTAGLRTWARYYLNGASFWEVDWSRVISYFTDVAAAMPNMRDSSGMTASERYRKALAKYADQIVKDDPCKAAEYYAKSLAIGNDPTVVPAATYAANRCSPPTETPRPQEPTGTATETATVTPTPGTTVAPPAATETPTPTTAPATETPTPTSEPPTATTEPPKPTK